MNKLSKDELLDRVHTWAWYAQDRMDAERWKKKHYKALAQIKSIIEQHFTHDTRKPNV